MIIGGIPVTSCPLMSRVCDGVGGHGRSFGAACMRAHQAGGGHLMLKKILFMQSVMRLRLKLKPKRSLYVTFTNGDVKVRGLLNKRGLVVIS